MVNYRRAYRAGGTWFFTVNLLQRQQNDLLVNQIGLLRETLRKLRSRYPFHINAWVVLPEHMHAIWTLPPDDADFSTRWRLIKSGFFRELPKTEYRSKIRITANERGIWQRHFWEPAIRDDLDFERHVDYLHFNPVKHGYVNHVRDWPFSSFRLATRSMILNLCTTLLWKSASVSRQVNESIIFYIIFRITEPVKQNFNCFCVYWEPLSTISQLSVVCIVDTESHAF